MRLFAAVLFTFSTSAVALDYSKCSTLMNNGWYKKYEYGGVDQPLTKATKKHGIMKASSVTGTEASTASVDPKYSSNVSTSQTQGTSSWGPCSAIGLRDMKTNRNLYIAQHKEMAFDEIAQGGGEHLRVVATFSLCEDQYFNRLGEKLQSRMGAFLNESEDYGAIVDSVIRSDAVLAKACYSFDKI